MLNEGQWAKTWDPYQSTSENGDFIRQISEFRNWITPDGKAGKTGYDGFTAEKNRYHLYISYVCPWASRTMMVRALKGLEDIISFSVVEPFLTDEGWKFGDYPGADIDSTYHTNYIHELYTLAAPSYTGRATVPVLWDKKRKTIVNNESADIIEMLNNAFNHITLNALDLRPDHIVDEMTELNNFIYEKINNGVYKAGFAQSQQAYQEAYESLFSALDSIEDKLNHSTYLFGEQLCEADIRLFVTVIRFDIAYHGLFKCNKKRIADYPNISRFISKIFEIKGIKETVNVDHIKTGYYSVKALNPNCIVPVGPEPALIY